MQAFAYGTWRSPIFFPDNLCVTCDSVPAYARQRAEPVVDEQSTVCADRGLAGCNWLGAPDAPGGLCSCCRLTRTHPADDGATGLPAFARTEAAKRRLISQLDHLGLPSTSPAVPQGDLDAQLAVTPTLHVDAFDHLVRKGEPSAMTLNAINRSMGNGDLYPFVLRSDVQEKLRFVHNVVTSQR